MQRLHLHMILFIVMFILIPVESTVPCGPISLILWYIVTCVLVGWNKQHNYTLWCVPVKYKPVDLNFLEILRFTLKKTN